MVGYDLMCEPRPDIGGDELEDERPVVLSPSFSGPAFCRAVAYPCIVERWDRVVGPGAYGSKRRAYQAEFTETERRVISKWHTRFYRWHLVTGTPLRVVLKLATLQLLQRAVNFFATV